MVQDIVKKIDNLVEGIRESNLLEMSQAEREKLPASAFVFPDREAWPIHDAKHALTAVNYMKAGRGDEKDYPAVKKALKTKWSKNKHIMKALSEV